jgi:hypothetical protein
MYRDGVAKVRRSNLDIDRLEQEFDKQHIVLMQSPKHVWVPCCVDVGV